MCKSEIFAEILNIVGKETEVSKELILSTSKVTEVVDARSIVVFFLTESVCTLNRSPLCFTKHQLVYVT